MKKRVTLGVILALGLVFVLSFALAAKGDDNESDGNGGVGNMTYGKCVSAAAAVKNVCYVTVKVTSESCKATAKNMTSGGKDAGKQCTASYKKEKKQCKTDFKATKKQECARIKHNFLETIGSSMK